MRNRKEFYKKVGIGASKVLLFGLFLTGTVVLTPVPAAWLIGKIVDAYEGIEAMRYRPEQIERAIRYLKSRKLIDIQKQYNKEVFFLTKLGRKRAKKLLKSFAVEKPKKWDGKWRIVIFDVPHTKKKDRDLFRQQLKNLGLANVQKSIWIHPYECRDQIFYLAGNIFLKPYIRYIVAEEITGEKDLRRRFGL